MDCARTVRRLGGNIAAVHDDNLKIYYRNKKENIRVASEELKQLAQENIPIECDATPVKYIEINGVLKGVRFQRNGAKKHSIFHAITLYLQQDKNQILNLLIHIRIHVYFMPEIMQMEQQI